jgi:xylulokinase
MLFLGVDLGSSSIKLSVLDSVAETIIASAIYPEEEQPIDSPEPGWAEQDPRVWWTNFEIGLQKLVEIGVDLSKVEAIGISYQMHGLVLVDEDHQVLRPSIIWCDSRSVSIGEEAFEKLGGQNILPKLLNSPGNFTASKLAWVKENEPDIYDRVHKFLLPGDYLVLKLTGQISTTATGLSEGIMWDYDSQSLSAEILDVFGFGNDLVPRIEPSIGSAVSIHDSIAEKFGFRKGTKITYRAGDQPNNAFSLNVLNPGETAATAGTSGVIYAVTDKKAFDHKSRINTFLHVNSDKENSRNGILICINGTGILYSWLKKLMNSGNGRFDYDQMNELAESVLPGSEGLICLPFGNGAERIFENKNIGSHILNVDFNRHSNAHLIRSGLEGIVFALNLGFEVLDELQITQKTIRVGNANLFLSKIFREIFVNVTGVRLEIYDTDGAAGAARGAALGFGFYSSFDTAFKKLELITVVEPDPVLQKEYKILFEEWKIPLLTTH